MADAATLLTMVKRRLDVSDVTTFDTDINEYVSTAVYRLFPVAQKKLATQEVTITPDTYGRAIVELSTAISGSPEQPSARQLEIYNSSTWDTFSDFEHNGTELIINGLSSSDSKVRIYPVTAYKAIADVPNHLIQAVVWYAMSEFYDSLSGSKSKYNAYMNSGAREVDNMRDESDYYEQKANVYLMDHTELIAIT